MTPELCTPVCDLLLVQTPVCVCVCDSRNSHFPVCVLTPLTVSLVTPQPGKHHCWRGEERKTEQSVQDRTTRKGPATLQQTVCALGLRQLPHSLRERGMSQSCLSQDSRPVLPTPTRLRCASRSGRARSISRIRHLNTLTHFPSIP